MSGRPWWNLSPHGTVAAYRRHRRLGEQACEQCKEALRIDWLFSERRKRQLGRPHRRAS